MFIINSLAPIFLLIAFGKLLQHSGIFTDGFFKGLNRLVFLFALPALLINGLSGAELDLRIILQMLLLIALGSVGVMLLAWSIARMMKLPAPSTGSFIQGAFRSNGAFIALPVIIYAVGSVDPRAETLGSVILAPVVILYNILGVSLLLHYGPRRLSAGESIVAFTAEILKNPLIIACAVGLALNLSGFTLPVFLARPIALLGGTALPLILLSIGASLEFGRLRGAASPSLIASLLKVAACPLLGLLLSFLFRDMNGSEKMIAILYLGSPAAGMSYVMAEVMGNDAPLAGRIVALSTLLSGLTLPIIIALGIHS